MKFQYIATYKNNSEKFDTGQCRIKVNVTAGVQNFPHLPQCTMLGPITQQATVGSFTLSYMFRL